MDATTFDQIRALGDLVTVWAHPDDESYLAGGLMAVAASLGARVTCVTATLGERGGAVDQQAETAWRRREELADALAALGVDDHVQLDLPDGRCAGLDAAHPVRAIGEVLADRRPATVVTFGPDGITGHPDHQAVSRWVSAAVLLHAAPRPRLLYAAETDAQAAKVRNIEGIYAPGLPRVRPPHELALHVRAEGWVLDAKLAALRAHRSQTAGLEALLGPAAYRDWVAEECFVAAPAPLAHRAVAHAAWLALEVAPA